MLPLLLVGLLGGTPFDLPADVSETMMPGSEPAIANAGTDVIVVWKDGRTEALFGRVERVRTPSPELWWNRVRSPGNTVSVRTGVPGCQTRGGLSFAVTANPATGRAWAGWLEEPTPMSSRLHLAVLDADGGVRCLAPYGTGQGNAGDLSLGWTGTKFFAVWREGTASKLTWCDASGACGPTGSLSAVSGAEHSLGGGVRNDGGVFVGADSSGFWTITRAEGVTGGGLSVGLTPATAVAVDPFGQIVGTLNAGNWEVTFPFGPTTFFIGRPLSTVSLAPSNTGLVVFETNTPSVLAYTSSGGMLQSPMFAPIGAPVLTRENAGARMAFVNSSSVSTMVISASTSQVNTELAGAIAVARPPQRNPSLAWAGDRWLVAYEEWFDGGWRPFATSVLPDGAPGPRQDAVFAGYDSPALVTAPDGGLFVRLSTASTTETRPALFNTTGLSLGPVSFSSSRTLAGSVTNAKAVHWSTNFLAPGTSSTARFSASSAVIPGGLLIPQRVAGTGIVVAHLADTASTLDGGPVRLMSMADPSGPISIASTFDGRGWVVLLGWYESGNLILTGFQPDGGGVSTNSINVPTAPNRGLAIAPWDTDFAVVSSVGTEVTLNRVTKAGAIVGGVGGIINNLNEVPGDPVVTVAPTGHVAVAWPALDPVSRSVAVRVSLFDPSGRDGGAAGGGAAGGGAAGGGAAGGGAAAGGAAGGGAAGGGAAGGGAAGGGAAGGGTAGGGAAGGGAAGGGEAGGGSAGGGAVGSADAGTATVDAGQAGDAPVIFASTCGCTSTSELSWMLGLLVAALARRRAHRG